MSGTKSFNPDAVLERAMRMFWARGYESVSIAELETATGLNRSSLYNAFGGKEAIFAAALARYSETMLAALLPGLEKPSLPAAIADFLERFDRALSDEAAPGGCLIFLAIYERSMHSRAVADILKRHSARLRQALVARLEDGVRSGELADKADISELAALLLAALAGLATSTRLKAPASERRSLITAVIHAITARRPPRQPHRPP